MQSIFSLNLLSVFKMNHADENFDLSILKRVLAFLFSSFFIPSGLKIVWCMHSPVILLKSNIEIVQLCVSSLLLDLACQMTLTLSCVSICSESFPSSEKILKSNYTGYLCHRDADREQTLTLSIVMASQMFSLLLMHWKCATKAILAS